MNAIVLKKKCRRGRVRKSHIRYDDNDKHNQKTQKTMTPAHVNIGITTISEDNHYEKNGKCLGAS